MNINERLEQKPDIYRCTGSNSDRRGFYAVIQINLGTVLLRMVCRPSCRRSIMGSNTDSLYQIPVLTERYSLRRRKDPHYHGAQKQFIKTNRFFLSGPDRLLNVHIFIFYLTREIFFHYVPYTRTSGYSDGERYDIKLLNPFGTNLGIR